MKFFHFKIKYTFVILKIWFFLLIEHQNNISNWYYLWFCESSCSSKFQGYWQVSLPFPVTSSLSLTLSRRRCVFPFFFEGVRHVSCASSVGGLPWCATDVDGEGAVVAADYCAPDYGRQFEQRLLSPLLPNGTICIRIVKISFKKNRDHKKNFLWASQLWVGRRKEPILGYVPKNNENENSGSNGLKESISSISFFQKIEKINNMNEIKYASIKA